MAKTKATFDKKGKVTEGWSKPVFTDITPDAEDYDDLLYKGMMFAHHEFNNTKLKEHATKWLEKNKIDISNIKKVSDCQFATFGKVAYLANNGAILKDESIDWMKNKADKLNQIQSEEQEEKGSKRQLTVQDYVQMQVNDIAAEFDGWVDEFITDSASFSMEGKSPMIVLKTNDAKAIHASKISSMYAGNLAEVIEALEGNDEQLNEGYSKYSKTELKKLKKLYEKIIFDADHLNEKAKVERKPRKRKAPNVEKMVKNVKYNPSDENIGLVSVKPADILGATVLWTYDVKRRKLAKFIAQDEAGFGFKGTTLTNYSIEQSVKKTVRKPEQMKEIKNFNKTSLEKLYKSLNSVETRISSGRMNADIILLKAFT